jgi:hypothetical protein
VQGRSQADRGRLSAASKETEIGLPSQLQQIAPDGGGLPCR